ncbi:MAG: glycosyl hydrolase 115 family protein [Prevotella sp.]|nr:glycosyl hydrolase 115 family protein [Prevotella sp.]
MRKILLFLASSLAFVLSGGAAEVVWFDGTNPVSYQVVGKVDPVVSQALQMFCSDMQQVTGLKPVASKKAVIKIQQGRGSDDGFSLSVSPEGQILVQGHNGRGTAYGLLELSRLAGVSPWVWWGDVTPERKARLTLDSDYRMEHTPSVAFRGIFINDEDWSLRNWAWKTYEKTDQFGAIGPKTYKAVFQLLLRLRANAIWPGMHTGTPGFFTIAGNKEMADSFGILVGTSHCEPLLRNNVAEWDVKQRGPYNYITNREQVQQYWIERLQQVKGSEELFTIGMRGIHDGSMEGVKTQEEKLNGLQQVIDDQRELIKKYYNKNVEQVPQVFIPYKEVLEIMESGLRVPDDVTLMWCDDNYGYMTRLSDAEQQRRQGGGGVYYHLSYWGRPHDYLWLTTTQPGLVYSEMRAAYDHNCRKLWIVNVHDPKVAAYDLEFFLDMAWDIDAIQPQTIYSHLERWLCTQFGEAAGRKLAPAMQEFYRLCAIRKPEFMGWTQVELDKKLYPRGRSQVIDTEFTQEFGNELDRYQASYARIARMVSDAEKTIRPELHDAYFAHVKYPVLAAQAMADKMLYAQKARSRYLGQTDRAMEGREDYMQQNAAASMAAYRTIQRLTKQYNEMGGGRWQGIMNMMPRDLNVFNPPILPFLPEETSVAAVGLNYTDRPSYADVVACNAADHDAASQGCQAIQMLGHSGNAVAIPQGGELVYHFTTQKEGAAVLYTAMIPTQPNDRGDLRYSVQLDEAEPVVISLKTPYRSDYWKQSVLRGQTLKVTPVQVQKDHHTLRIRALDDHIIIDQWMLDFQQNRKFYVIPAQ